MADIGSPITGLAITFLLYLIYSKLCELAAHLGVKDEEDEEDPEEGSEQPQEPKPEEVEKPVDGMLH